MACLARCVLSKDVPCALTQQARNTNVPCVVFPTCRFCFEVVLGNKTFHMKRNDTDASPQPSSKAISCTCRPMLKVVGFRLHGDERFAGPLLYFCQIDVILARIWHTVFEVL